MPLEIVPLFHYFQFPTFDNNNMPYAQSCEVCKDGWWFLNEGMSDFNRYALAFECNSAFWFVSCSCQGMMKFCHKSYVKKHVLFFCSVVDDSCWITMSWRCVWKQCFPCLYSVHWLIHSKLENSIRVAISWSCLVLVIYGKLIRCCKFVIDIKLCLPLLINALSASHDESCELNLMPCMGPQSCFQILQWLWLHSYHFWGHDQVGGWCFWLL